MIENRGYILDDYTLTIRHPNTQKEIKYQCHSPITNHFWSALSHLLPIQVYAALPLNAEQILYLDSDSDIEELKAHLAQNRQTILQNLGTMNAKGSLRLYGYDPRQKHVYRLKEEKGTIVERIYHLTKTLGSGCCGDVYLLEAASAKPNSAKLKVIKIVRAHDIDPQVPLLERQRALEREYWALEECSQWNIAKPAKALILDVKANPLGLILPFYATTCESRLSTLTVRESATLILDLLDQLVLMHSHGKFHGDFKLDNLMVSGLDKNIRAHLIDFGNYNYGNPLVGTGSQAHDMMLWHALCKQILLQKRGTEASFLARFSPSETSLLQQNWNCELIQLIDCGFPQIVLVRDRGNATVQKSAAVDFDKPYQIAVPALGYLEVHPVAQDGERISQISDFLKKAKNPSS